MFINTYSRLVCTVRCAGQQFVVLSLHKWELDSHLPCCGSNTGTRGALGMLLFVALASHASPSVQFTFPLKDKMVFEGRWRKAAVHSYTVCVTCGVLW